jgi:hypothetical protein
MDILAPFLPEVIKPKEYNGLFIYVLGFTLSLMNKIRHSVWSYRTPRPFSSDDIDRNVNYCLDVVSQWKKILKYYTGREKPFENQHVLELGPGPDLGTGVILLALGAKSYCAIDKYRLASLAPKDFYKRLFERIQHLPQCEMARKIFQEFKEAESERFRYIYDPNFHLDALPSNKYQILVTQAVLEHLHEIKNIFTTLRQKLSRDGWMINEVDLSTHTRFLRDWDPLNILRYSHSVYNLLRFNESPNRWRMSDYESSFNELGYKHVKTFPIKILDLDYTRRVSKQLSHPFRKYPLSDLKVLSCYLLASAN